MSKFAVSHLVSLWHFLMTDVGTLCFAYIRSYSDMTSIDHKTLHITKQNHKVSLRLTARKIDGAHQLQVTRSRTWPSCCWAAPSWSGRWPCRPWRAPAPRSASGTWWGCRGTRRGWRRRCGADPGARTWRSRSPSAAEGAETPSDTYMTVILPR